MKKIRINTSDKHRVLLTDVLPYETPLYFSNEGFYHFCKNHLHETPPILKKLIFCFDGKAKEMKTIPYNYDIRKDIKGVRTLSLFHPAIQLQMVLLYERFSHVIIHLCTRSRFSLRYPASVASAINDHEDNGDTIQIGSKYFHYEKYDLLYQFYESYEFQRLEKRFNHLRIYDISKCFNHIYTHTISWAVRSKEFAKRHINNRSFDTEFDAIMQAANYKETAGILIGPEISRIFAEIILQRIDAAVEKRLTENNIKCGLDYDVRRYVDDYYVFSKTRETSEEVMNIYREELKHYRLNFNEAKTIEMVVPFMTSISCAKIALSDVIGAFFESLIKKNVDGEEEKYLFKNLGKKTIRLIQKIKSVVTTHGVDYVSISRFMLSIIEHRLDRLLIKLSPYNNTENNVQGFLYAVLDVVFFIYAMDVRVSTTYKVGKVALAVCKVAMECSPEAEELVKKKIYDETKKILESETRSNPQLYVETLNLLVIIRKLGSGYRVPPEIISRMITSMDRPISETEIKGVDYFLVTALLFHIADDPFYRTEKDDLLKRIQVLFENSKKPWDRTDFTCLFLDLLSCPYITDKYKKKLSKTMTNELNLTRQEKDDIHRAVSSHRWFTDWYAHDNIEILLEKKQHKSPY